MSNVNAETMATLDGLFKDQFAPQMEDLIPEFVLLQGEGALIQHIPQDKIPGEFYSVPTVLRSNQGVTYAGESGGVTALKDAKPGLMKEAQIKGSELIVRGQISYGALSRAAEQGAQAYRKASAWLVEDLARVAHTRLEFSALYGQDSLGVIESVTGTGVEDDELKIVITDDSFSPGIWALSEGARIEVFSEAGAKRGNSGLLLEVVGVDSVARQISCVIAAGTNSGGGGAIAEGDTLHFESARAGATTWNEMVGLKKQMSSNAGTLFNIDRAYSLMQGNVIDLKGAPPTKAAITKAVMKAVDKGCMDKMVVLAGTKTFSTLHAEDMNLRRFDGSYKPEKAESGTEKIVYRSVNGPIEIVCHPLVKNGDLFILNPKETIWVGSRKPTFDVPGSNGERFWQLIPGSTAVELQNYSDLAVYTLKPARTVFVTGAKNQDG